MQVHPPQLPVQVCPGHSAGGCHHYRGQATPAPHISTFTLTSTCTCTLNSELFLVLILVSVLVLVLYIVPVLALCLVLDLFLYLVLDAALVLVLVLVFDLVLKGVSAKAAPPQNFEKLQIQNVKS